MDQDPSRTPKVSIILPAYNHAHFLPESIGSALGQTYPDFELILVDDGSTDQTRELVAGYLDPRIRYHYQDNRGLAAARNTGLRLARGEFIAFLDADDLFMPTKLEQQIRFFETHKAAGLSAGGWKYIDAAGEWIGEYWPWPDPPDLTTGDWLGNCFVNPVSVLVRREWIERVGGFDESLKQVEDWDLWLRLAYAGCRMAWVETFVCAYRFSANQMTRNAAEQKRAAVQMLDKFFAQNGLPERYRAIRGQVYGRLYRVSAGRELAAGQVDEARGSLSLAAKHQPELRMSWAKSYLEDLFSPVHMPGSSLNLLDFADRLFKIVPEDLPGLQAKRRWTLGEMGLRDFYAAHEQRDWLRVRRAARLVAANAPHRLLNRGALSVLWQSRAQAVRVAN